MTKEEAINWLKQISDRHIHEGDEAYDEKRREAIDMAIFALGIRADMPPDDPLTLEELREMDGEPVWICDPDGSDGMWALVDLEYELCRTAKGGIAIFDTYGKTWLAYRRKPKGD